jgi:DNA-binding beta-propeller fold protein YncE
MYRAMSRALYGCYPVMPRSRAVALVTMMIASLAACAHAPPGSGAAATPSLGNAEVIAGGGSGGDGSQALAAKLTDPFAVARDAGGNLYVAEMLGNRVRRIDAAGIVTTVAGTGEKADGGDGGPGSAARFNGPHHLVIPPGGSLVYIADTFNNRVRVLEPQTGVVKPLAGTGEKAFGGEGGPAVTAQFSGVFCLDFDTGAKHLYVADLGNRRVRRVDLGSGVVTTVAGNGDKGIPTDGADALQSPLLDPRAVAVDAQGNLYILERNGHALRVVDKAGKIRTVAGNGEKGAGGDGGDARAAQLNGPKHLTVDRDGSVLIVDTENHSIRRYDPRDGRITRFIGAGTVGSAGAGGPALAVQLARPHGVYVDRDGSLLVSDSENHRILRVTR